MESLHSILAAFHGNIGTHITPQSHVFGCHAHVVEFFFLYDSRHEYKKRVTTAHIFGDNLCNYLAVVTSGIHVHIG